MRHENLRPILALATPSRSWIVTLAVLAVGLCAGAPGGAQQFSARTDLVEVYATITDEKGRLVTDVGRDELTVLEDGVPQEIAQFAAGDQPVSLALAVDRSWSMAGQRLIAAQRGIRELLWDLDDTRDRTTLVAIGSDIDVVVPLTNDRSAVDAAVQGLDPWGATALHDAIVTAFDIIEPAAGRRALVLLSDGVERHSEHSVEDVLSRVRASDVLAYPVVIERKVPRLLEQAAELTGGRASRVKDVRDLPTALRRIASELRHQYLLGYVSSKPGVRGQYRRIDVRVSRAKHNVRARAGYVLP